MAQLSSAFHYLSCFPAFVELIQLNDLLNDVTFLFFTNQKPEKNLQTDGQQMTDGQKSDVKSEVALAKKVEKKALGLEIGLTKLL